MIAKLLPLSQIRKTAQAAAHRALMSLLPDFDRATSRIDLHQSGRGYLMWAARAVTQLDEARQVFDDAAEGLARPRLLARCSWPMFQIPAKAHRARSRFR